MWFLSSALLLIAVGSTVECARNTPRSPRASRNEGSLEFECPEEFGYYAHPRDCTQYYVCVFGGALLESCTGGLMYSHELQTCDWPRNVGCHDGGSIAKDSDEDDALLERAAKVESVQLQHQQHNQQQHHRSESRQHQRQPSQRQQQIAVTSSAPPVSQITERQSRQRQSQQLQHQRIYPDVEYEPATEIESDRQQRVYRGQPSTIGQVQRDRDGLRRNIISVSHPTSTTSSSGHTVTRQSIAFSNDNIVNQGPGRRDRYDKGQRNHYDPNPTRDPTEVGSTNVASSNPEFFDYRGLSYSSESLDSEFDDGLENRPVYLGGNDNANASAVQIDLDRSSSPGKTLGNPREASVTISTIPGGSSTVVVTSNGHSTIEQPRSTNEVSFSSPSSIAASSQRNEELEKNEISVTTRLIFDERSTDASTTDPIDRSEEIRRPTRPSTFRDVVHESRSTDEFFPNPSSPAGLKSTEEVDRNEISVTPGSAGRGFMIKRLRTDHRVPEVDEDVITTTPAHSRYRSTTPQAGHSHRAESRIREVTSGPSSIRQRSRNSLVASNYQPRPFDKSVKTSEDRDSTGSLSSPGKTLFTDLDNRKYYIASIPRSPSDSDPEIGQISSPSIDRQSADDSKTRKLPANDNETKYYVPSSSPRRLPQDPTRQTPTNSPKTAKTSEGPLGSTSKASFIDDVRSLPDSSTLNPAQGQSKDKDASSTEDPAKNEIYSQIKSSRRNFPLTAPTLIPKDGESMARQRPVFRGQTRHRTQIGNRRSSILEREKESVVNSRGQTDGHYRTISSESPRTVKTTASTAAPVSKVYYSDADQSYPYYTIYDDDVSIYKDDDYGQYTVNRSEQIPQQQSHQQEHQQNQHHQQHQSQSNHNQHRQQNVRIAEITPNSNQYNQKSKKVTDSNKYNLSPEVTVSDYDIYDNEPLKNTFRISDEQQSLRTNGISHPAVHVTTPNAIVDNYVPLTTTTQPPSTTTTRPYTATVQTRGRPQQVNRGTAPPRVRPTLKPSTAIVTKAQEFVDIYRHPAVRPPPIYPTPTVDKPAAKCRKDVCLLPDCNCGGVDIPGGLAVQKVPQIVLVTFDDAVNDLNKKLYEDLFQRGRKNPNGCPISATFYVSHEWTDYSQVQNLYADGHEMASHTISHSFGEQFSARKWGREIAGQREILAAYGGVKLEDVRGMRAPFLSVGGNNMFKMLWDTNFTYDSSMPIYENRPPSWPYTLDYKLFHDCMIPPCPTKSYPGLWEVPMVMWQDLNGGRCSMGDACSNPPTPDGVYKMLIKNFERHYTTNRAPFGLFYHAAWFTQPHHKEGFISFLDTIVAMDDVWVVTNWQALQWMRNPTPLQLLDRFEPFGCNYPDRPQKCNNAKVCNLWHKSGVRYMKTCQPCPDIYPWTGKTGIRSSRIDNEIEK